MVQKMKQRFNKMIEARKENSNNEGFTLVELIVVIVILAILIGVTIGGVYGYVNKARVNTDINNASAIQSALSVLATDKDVISETGKTCTIEWTDEESKDAIPATGEYANLKSKVGAILTDGLPASKSGSTFKIIISTDDKGSVSVSCKAYKDGDPLKSDEDTAESESTPSGDTE